MKFTSGKIDRAQRIGLYGPEGIGKSSLAAQFEKPLFIDLENGTDQLDVKRMSGVADWEELIEIVQEVTKRAEMSQNPYKTLVIDTVDRAEQMAADFICRKYQQSGLESFGYGRGYTYLAETWTELLAALDQVIKAGLNVILIAHAKQRKIETPDHSGTYDHWEMKLYKQIAPLCKEWVDMLLFLNYQNETIGSETEGQKSLGGARLMFTSHTALADAKNRHGLPEVMELDYGNIMYLFEKGRRGIVRMTKEGKNND